MLLAATRHQTRLELPGKASSRASSAQSLLLELGALRSVLFDARLPRSPIRFQARNAVPSGFAPRLIPISVLRDHSKMREVSHRTEMLRVGFQLIESFTHLVNHGIKRGKSKI